MSAGIIATALKFAQDWAALATAGAALVVLFGGKGPLSALARWRNAVVGALFRPIMAGARAETLAQAILVELKTNGGSSLKDAINRIEERQVRMDGRINLMLTPEDAVAAFEADHQGLCIWISPAHAKLTGRPLDEVKGRGWLSFVHADDADHVRDGWLSAVAGGWPFSMRFRLVRRDGAVVLVHSTANPLMAGLRTVGWSGLITVEES